MLAQIVTHLGIQHLYTQNYIDNSREFIGNLVNRVEHIVRVMIMTPQ